MLASKYMRPWVITSFLTAVGIVYLWEFNHVSSPPSLTIHNILHENGHTEFGPIKDRLIAHPVGQGNDGDFGEMGRRVQILNKYIAKADRMEGPAKEALLGDIEELAFSMFPFLTQHPSNDTIQLELLRKRVQPGSKGIVIPVGKAQFRFASHLIACLRNVLKTKLPIQIAYAGDADLPLPYRTALATLGSHIQMLDVSLLFNNTALQLQGDWAIKPFALLGSSLEQVILLDADAVPLLDPEVVFEYDGYVNTGAYFFHDRLLWQNVFKDRQNWWAAEFAAANNTPSTALSKSLVYTEGYAEEQDSGMIVLDKRRVGIFGGLLHICWQNSYEVRKAKTYKLTYGDKESWWFGLELSGVEYAFEKHYGSIAGSKVGDKVCSFTIAHPDARDKQKLLWYNGSLLKNKAINATEFEIPTYWMQDAEWEKGQQKKDMSCMKGGKVLTILEEQVDVARRSVEAAKEVDGRYKNLI